MKILRIVTRAASFTVVLLGDVGASYAQPVSTSSSSVEWIAANSRLIVRALIDDITVHDPDDSFHRYQTVSVRVLETIKGEHSDRLQFVHDGDFHSVRLSELQNNKQEVLLFLDHWMRSPKFTRPSGGYAYARFPHVVKSVAILTPEDVQLADTSVPLLSSNLTKLSTPKQLIDTIKTYLKNRRDQRPVRGATIILPAHLRGGYWRAYFTFPVDSAVTEPVVDFETFKDRFAKEPPAEKKPPYTRQGSGYVGVYALELMAADCDVIVRGVIEDSCFVAATDGPAGNSCGVKMRVLETLKGEAPKQINFYVTDARDLDHLQLERQELVVFLRNQSLSPPATALGYQTRDSLWDDSVIVLNHRDAEVLFADLTWHRDPDGILRRLRAVTERERMGNEENGAESLRYAYDHTGPPVFDVHPPASIAAGSSIAGNDYSRIYIPVDQDLEANAQRWAAASNKDFRWLAARAMIYFNSDKNAANLKAMLDDNATWERRDMLHLIGSPYKGETPEFLVRWESWHVLDGWGYDVPKPSFGVSGRINR